MKAIICGAGQVGFGIARQLAVERNDVTVIDLSPALVARVAQQLDVRTVQGHGAHPGVLERAGARDADMIIAVTFYDEVNMVACQVSHSLFKVPTKIARVRAQSYLQPIWQDLFSRDHMPIDVIISPEVEVGEAVMRHLALPGAFESVSFAEDAVTLVGINLAPDCPVLNTPLAQLTTLFPDLPATVVGVVRNAELFVPDADRQLHADDSVYVVSATHSVDRTLSIFGHREKEARRVIIMGAGSIGCYVAEKIEKTQPGMKVRVIESDKERATRAADLLNRAVVLHGDALDPGLLREAGIAETEAVVALTNNDQANILACAMGKRLGGRHVLCLINDPVYAPLLGSFGIDAYLNPRATTVSSILRHVRRGRVKGLHSVHDGAAEVVDAEALDTSPLVGQPLREVDLPEGVIVGAVVRNGSAITPRGGTEIRTGDRVIMFALTECAHQVERMFRVSLEYF